MQFIRRLATIRFSCDSVHQMPKRKQLRSLRAFNKRCKFSSSTNDDLFIAPKTNSKMSSSVEILATPRKSANDKKEYRVIKLENGLKCLLISDTSFPLDQLDKEQEEEENSDGEEEGEEEEDDESNEEGEESEDSDDDEASAGERPPSSIKSTHLKMSAAGLMVHMGSFSDPEDIPGLAHFLEHMVFMGSKKYPDENGFDRFIAKHGGYDNASTDTETTVFYFSSPRRYFQEAVDRFSQFFIAPLMKQNAMEREREAVDSEFQMAFPSDSNRICQVMGGLASSGHPMAKFMWGNKKSLSPPGLTNEEMHKRLHEFRLRHYTAQSMYLTVQSQQSLDTLQDWVVQSFSDVPNNGLEREEFSQLTKPFTTPDWHRLYRFIPVKNEYKIDMTWELPPMLQHYRSKPLHYLGHLLGHEGKGSLVSFLRRKVWALSLTAGNCGDGFEYNSTYSMFNISIILTKDGYDNVEQIAKAIFAYLDMIKAEPPSERIFKEIQTIEDLDFAFSEERQAVDNVEDICENMGFYPPEHYLDGDNLLFDFDPSVIQSCLDKLTRDSVNIFLRSKEISSETLDKIEPWFGTPFSSAAIPEEWKQPSEALLKEFHLPEPNVFIAEDTSLCPADKDAKPKKMPDVLIQDDQGELFYRHDDVFLQVSGLSDKLPALLDLILLRLASFTNDISEQMFQAVAEQQRKNYQNHSIKPKHLVRDVRLSVLQDVYYPAYSKFNLVRGFSLDQLKDFCKKFLSKLFLQGLVQGNISREEAKQLDVRVRNILKCSPMAKNAKDELRCQKLPQGKFYLRVDSLDKKDANTLITNYYQYGPGNIRDHAILETIVMMLAEWPLELLYKQMSIEEPVFDTLRTQEQLGYSVAITLRNTHGIIGASVTVNTQATKFTVEHVDERIEAFFQKFIEEELDEEKVAEAVAALIKLKLRADVTLEEEVHRNWNEIFSKEYTFNRAEKEVEALNSIRLSDVKTYLLSLLKEKKLSVQVEGSSNPDSAQETVLADSDNMNIKLIYKAGDNFITDPSAWKSKLETYPVVYITK